MIREYCDKCHKEIEQRYEQEGAVKVEVDSRFVVTVKGGPPRDKPDWMKDTWQISEDVLCRDCVKNFSIGDPTDE